MESFQSQNYEVAARFEFAPNQSSPLCDFRMMQTQNQGYIRPDANASRYLPSTQIQLQMSLDYGYDPRGNFSYPNRVMQYPHFQSVQDFNQPNRFDKNYWDRYWSAYFGNDRFNFQSRQNYPYPSQYSFDYQHSGPRERFESQRQERNPRNYNRDQYRDQYRVQYRDQYQDQDRRAETNQDDLPERRDGADRDQYTRPESDQGKTVIQVRPGESIQSALDKAPPGAIVRVQPGTYRERLRIGRDNVTLQGEKGAILDFGSTNISGAAIQISDRQNVKIEGFEIRNVRGGGTPTAIRVDGASRNISIINNDIHHVESSSNAHAIAVYGTKSSAIQNIVIAGNKVHDLKLGQSEAVVLNGNVDGFKILQNKIYNTDNIAIDIIGGEGVGKAGTDRARNGLIAGNEITNVDSRRNPTYRSACAAGIYVDGGADVVIEDNVVKNANYGIELASERRGWKTERIQVRRNRLESNNLAGISLGGGSSSNGGVHEVTIQDNQFANNARTIWKQSNVGRITEANNKGM